MVLCFIYFFVLSFARTGLPSSPLPRLIFLSVSFFFVPHFFLVGDAEQQPAGDELSTATSYARWGGAGEWLGRGWRGAGEAEGDRADDFRRSHHGIRR
ncbi:hypothetical protein Dimus_039530 [Dionaea muscipula]